MTGGGPDGTELADTACSEAEQNGRMPMPSATPAGRGLAEILSADTYRPGQRVWLFRGSWRPAVVLHSSQRAAMVRYSPSAGRGTGVDTAIAADLAMRDEFDSVIDGQTP